MEAQKSISQINALLYYVQKFKLQDMLLSHLSVYDTLLCAPVAMLAVSSDHPSWVRTPLAMKHLATGTS